MTVDEPGPGPGLTDEALAARIAKGFADQERQARIAEQEALVMSLVVPLGQLDKLLELWIKARRLDEGATRPMKPDHLAHQIKLAKMNAPLLALIRAAYRAGIYDALYRPTDQEES